MYRMFLFISGQEIFIILLVVLLLFGANKIPEIARGLGKGMREFRKAADDIKREMNNHSDDIKKDFKDLDDNIKETNDDLKG
ncbi:MAG: twin-arginine translocase TatA/TatE family subunit [Bacteroidota bacterium]